MRKLMTWFWILLALVGAAYSQTGWYPVVYKYGTSSPSDYVVLNSETGALMWTGHNVVSQSFAVNRDSMFVYALENDTVVCRDANTGNLLYRASFPNSGQQIMVVGIGDSLYTIVNATYGKTPVLYTYSYDLSSVDSVHYSTSISYRTGIIHHHGDSLCVGEDDYYFTSVYLPHADSIGVCQYGRNVELGYNQSSYINYDVDGGFFCLSYNNNEITVLDSTFNTIYHSNSLYAYHSAAAVGNYPYFIVSESLTGPSRDLVEIDYSTGTTVGYTETYSDKIYSLAVGADTAIYAGSAGSATTYVRKFSTAEPWGSAESPVWSYTASTATYYYTDGDPTGYWHKKLFSGKSWSTSTPDLDGIPIVLQRYDEDSSGYNQSYAVFDVSDGDKLWEGHKSRQQWFAVNKDKGYLYVTEKDTMVCRDLTTGDLLYKSNFSNQYQRPVMVIRGDTLFAYAHRSLLGYAGTVYFYTYDLSSVDSLIIDIDTISGWHIYGDVIAALIVPGQEDSIYVAAQINGVGHALIKTSRAHIDSIGYTGYSRYVLAHCDSGASYNWDGGVLASSGSYIDVIDKDLNIVYSGNDSSGYPPAAVPDSLYFVVSATNYPFQQAHAVKKVSYVTGNIVGYVEVPDNENVGVNTISDSLVFIGSRQSICTYSRAIDAASWNTIGSFPITSEFHPVDFKYRYYRASGDPSGYWHQRFYSSSSGGKTKAKAKQRRRLKWVF